MLGSTLGFHGAPRHVFRNSLFQRSDGARRRIVLDFRSPADERGKERAASMERLCPEDVGKKVKKQKGRRWWWFGKKKKRKNAKRRKNETGEEERPSPETAST